MEIGSLTVISIGGYRVTSVLVERDRAECGVHESSEIIRKILEHYFRLSDLSFIRYVMKTFIFFISHADAGDPLLAVSDRVSAIYLFIYFLHSFWVVCNDSEFSSHLRND